MSALWDWGCSLLAWKHAPACTRRIESHHIIRRLITSHLLSLILIITSHLFPSLSSLFPLSENSQTSFLYSFSFALMCLTHLLFSSFFFSPTPLYPLILFFLFCLSFSVLLCVSPCVLSLQSVAVPPLIFSLGSHQAN